jgi:hypothetical protein
VICRCVSLVFLETVRVNISEADSLQKVVQLRELLREQFPQAHRPAPAALHPKVEAEDLGNPTFEPDTTQQLLSGIPTLDGIGIPRNAITEIVSERSHSGLGLVLNALIRQAAARDELFALVDGLGSFDPLYLEPEIRPRLLWARSESAEQAIKAADLLLRDGNIPTVALDLQLNDRREVRALSSSCWYRLRNLVEEAGITFVLFTSCETAPSAHLRLVLDWRFRLNAMDELRGELERQIRARVARSRVSTAPETRLSA